MSQVYPVRRPTREELKSWNMVIADRTVGNGMSGWTDIVCENDIWYMVRAEGKFLIEFDNQGRISNCIACDA